MGISCARHLGDDGSFEPNSLPTPLAGADPYTALRGSSLRELRGKTKRHDDLSLALSFLINPFGRGGSL